MDTMLAFQHEQDMQLNLDSATPRPPPRYDSGYFPGASPAINFATPDAFRRKRHQIDWRQSPAYRSSGFVSLSEHEWRLQQEHPLTPSRRKCSR